MPRYALRLHLDKTTQTFTADVDQLPERMPPRDDGRAWDSSTEDAAIRDEYMAKRPYEREIGEDGADGLKNDIYITDDMREYIDFDVRAGFLLMRNLYLVSEDAASCEMIVCVAETVGEEFPYSVNFVAYGEKLFERIYKNRKTIEAMIAFYENPDYDRLTNAERRMLAHFDARAANPGAWMADRRKRVAKPGAFFLRDEAGNVFPIRKSLCAITDRLDELLEQAMQGKDKRLSPDSRFSISCDFDERLTEEVRLFEGSAEEWKAWETCAAAMEYTEKDFQKIMEGRRNEAAAEKDFAYYREQFIRRNRTAREAPFASLREAYRNYWNV